MPTKQNKTKQEPKRPKKQNKTKKQKNKKQNTFRDTLPNISKFHFEKNSYQTLV